MGKKPISFRPSNFSTPLRITNHRTPSAPRKPKSNIGKFGQYLLEKAADRAVDGAVRYAQSWTQTKTKTETKAAKEQANATNNTTDKMVLVKRKPLKRTRGKFKFTKTQSYVNGFSEGLQAVNTVMHWCNVDQMLSSGANAWRDYDWPTNIFAFNPNAKISGSSIVSNPDPSESEINIERYTVKQSVTSLQNNPQTVYLFYYLCKKDTDSSAESCWTQDLAKLDQNVLVATTDDNIGGTSNTTTLGGATVNMYGQFPNTKGELSRNWKLLRVKKFVLQPGDTKNVEWVAHINRRIKRTQLEGLQADGLSFMSGVTIQCLAVVQGSPYLVTDTGVPTQSSMTYSGTKIGMITTSTYTFSAPPEPTPAPLKLQKYEIRVNGATAGKIIDEDGDEVLFDQVN